jgi:tRNA-Thr(GGU) m(6)t(6)A37 methyltransferase TsaA
MEIVMEAIGTVRTAAREVPRFYSVSEVEGRLEIDARYAGGLKDIRAGDRIVVLFAFHRSPPFRARDLIQVPPRRSEPRGVFSTCSPVRPNPIGSSVVTVLAVEGTTLTVKGLDMLDGSPILDIKPYKSAG